MKTFRLKLFVLLMGIVSSGSLLAGVQLACLQKGEGSRRLLLTKGESAQIQFENYDFQNVSIKGKRVMGTYWGEQSRSLLPHGFILFDLPVSFSELNLNQSFEISLKHKAGFGRQPYRDSVVVMQCQVESSYTRSSCEQDLKSLQTAKIINDVEENKSFLKAALKVARSNFGSGYFYAVDYLEYEANGVRKGARVVVSDDRDPGQANTQVYYFVAHELTHKPVLIAIEDQPHCCAPFTTEWVCQDPTN